MSLEEKIAYMRQLQHAMQSGVAFDQDGGSDCGSPKHLRVGVNSAMVDHGALVELLILKNVFSKDEYMDALIKGLESEVKRYETMLSKKTGCTVVLE